MRTGLAIGLLMMAAQASGEVLLITDAGAWMSRVDSAGIPSWVQVGTSKIQVVDERGVQPDDPDDPVDTLAVQVEKWTRAIHPTNTTTNLGMAEVYRIGSEQSSGGLGETQTLKLVSLLSDEVLKEQKATGWQPWRTSVSDAVDGRLQRGEPLPTTLDSIERGLRASTDDQAINPDNLQKLLDFILKILPLILKLLGL